MIGTVLRYPPDLTDGRDDDNHWQDSSSVDIDNSATKPITTKYGGFTLCTFVSVMVRATAPLLLPRHNHQLTKTGEIPIPRIATVSELGNPRAAVRRFQAFIFLFLALRPTMFSVPSTNLLLY